MIGFIIWPLLAIGCFYLAIKGFSRKGIPLAGKKRIHGAPAVAAGVFCLLFGLACSGVAAMLILDHLGADPLGFDRDLREAVDKAETLSMLVAISSEIRDVQLATASEPPREVLSLVKWIARNRPAFLDEPFVDKQSLTLRDGWERPLRILVDDKGVMSLASNGANGTWDNGGQDDMMSHPIPPIWQP